MPDKQYYSTLQVIAWLVLGALVMAGCALAASCSALAAAL